jgi:hypothetical protein
MCGCFDINAPVCRYNSSTSPGWIWKGDTSSDEIVGHVLMHAALGALVSPPQATDDDPGDAASAKASSSGPGDERPARRLRGKSANLAPASPASSAPRPGGALGRQALLDATLGPVRAEAAEVLGGLMSAIIANNYMLIDPGLGVPTTWGRWDPEDTNNARFYR